MHDFFIWTGFWTKYLTCSNTEWFRRRNLSWVEGLAKFHPGQRLVSVCHHRYCTIHILTDPWSLDDGRIFGLHPREVMHSALPTQCLFTPDRLLHSFWADSTDREGAERQKFDTSRNEMGLERCKGKEIRCDATKNEWGAQSKVQRCWRRKEGCGQRERG